MLFSFSITLLLPSILFVSDSSMNSIKWRNSTYRPFEKCMLYSSTQLKTCKMYKNDASSWSAQFSSSLTDFPACRLRFTNSLFLDSKTRLLSREVDSNITCTIRPKSRIEEFKSHLAELSTYDMKTNNDVHPIIEMLDIVRSKNISVITFFGDSISFQIGTFLGCDMLRTEGIKIIENDKLLNPPHLQRMNDRKSSLVIEYKGHRIHFFVISPSVRSLCMYDHRYKNPDCIDSVQRKLLMFYYVYDKLKKAAAITNSTAAFQTKAVVIFNWGLHVNQGNKDSIVSSMVKALVRFAKDYKGKYFLFFRETSGGVGGNYVIGDDLMELVNKGKVGKDSRELCCDTFTDDPGERDVAEGQPIKVFNFANRYFIHRLEKFEKNFRNLIPIIPFYNFSSLLSRYHLEGYKDIVDKNAQITPDCTHFLYVPLLFDNLWREISKTIRQAVN